MKRIIVAITGASGAVYGVRTLQLLKDIADTVKFIEEGDQAAKDAANNPPPPPPPADAAAAPADGSAAPADKGAAPPADAKPADPKK